MNNFIKSNKNPFQTILIILAAAVIFMGCGESNNNSPAIDSYRVQIGDKSLTFKQQMLYVMVSLELYRLHTGSYPNETNNLDALIVKPEILEATGEWKGPYALSDKVFLDPWNHRLIYSIDQNGKVDLRSYGKDGAPSDDDILAKDMFPDLFRELEKMPKMGPIPVVPAEE